MANPKGKKKFQLWYYPETEAKIIELYKKDGCKTKSEFIEKAIIFYCGFLTAPNYREYLPNVVLSTMKGTLDSFENRMARLLFKMAVEIAMMLHVTAASNNIEKDTLNALRGMCVDEVKKIQGTIKLEDAVSFQNYE